jgi:hypothetical protein
MGRREPRGLDQAPIAKPPKQLATPPADVAKVIAEGRARTSSLALYLWLAAITGSRRGELCAVQVLACPGRQATLGRKSAAAPGSLRGRQRLHAPYVTARTARAVTLLSTEDLCLASGRVSLPRG